MPLGTEIAQALGQRLSYCGRKFSFDVTRLRLPNGAEGEWECIRHPGGALAVPFTNDGQLVLVRQYRFAMQGRLLEFPAGTVEVGEDPAKTIRREIEEETGYSAATWRNLGDFPIAPGYSDELIYAYLATDLTRLETPPSQDDDEDIEVVLMTPAVFEETVRSGVMVDAKTVTSYFLAKPFLVS
ncbi:MAG: NUDIX hydrolase [Oscillatoriales cyanobacterium]|nr:MAG: NUDIX hydrolase [Oscillatoriales cyanobacterium]